VILKPHQTASGAFVVGLWAWQFCLFGFWHGIDVEVDANKNWTFIIAFQTVYSCEVYYWRKPV